MPDDTTAPVTAEDLRDRIGGIITALGETRPGARDAVMAEFAPRLRQAEAEVERLADFGLKERERHEAKLASLQAFADRCREKDWAYAAERTRERDEARAERDALKAELREWATRLAHATGAVPAVDIAWKLRQIVGELEADRG